MKVLLPALIISFVALSCKKPAIKRNTINIILKHKSLSTIKGAIQGRWQLHYAYGGYSGHTRVNYANRTIEFKGDDHIKEIYQSKIIVDTVIKWERIKDYFFEGDSIFILSFNDLRGYPYSWGVEGIYNDTLLLFDYAADGMGYHLTRIEN